MAGGESATIGGGAQNETTANYSTIGGGRLNEATAQYSTVGGGDGNLAANSNATVAGGSTNEARGQSATVGGGANNSAVGLLSTIPGGSSNRATGTTSFAAGYKARANHDGAFVWNDRSVTTNDDSLLSTGANQFIIRAAGGVGIGTNDPKEQLHLNSGGPTAIFLGGNGSGNPHGIIFDDESPGNGVQLMWRGAPNRLVIEAASTGTSSNPVDAFFFDRDDFNFGFSGVVRPINDDSHSLGTGSFRWSEVFATEGTINTSDARLKTNVSNIESGIDAVMDLRPVRFRW
ncbi:MAG: tail fiber domain-containing protein, partial [Halobacteriales archaeon]|nr:tail fiber domain-containing protein [Halobacteriales archaeon]